MQKRLTSTSVSWGFLYCDVAVAQSGTDTIFAQGRLCRPTAHRFCRAGGRQTPANKDRLTGNDRWQEGQPYSHVASLLGVQQRGDLFSRPLHQPTPQYVRRQQQQQQQQEEQELPASFISMTSKGNIKGNHSSKTSNRSNMGPLASAVFLALCPTAGNAFIGRPPQPTVSSAARKQASTNNAVGAPPLGGFFNTRQPGTDDAPSRIGSNGAVEIDKHRSRVFPLHAFKGAEPDITEAGNTTAPILGGVDGVEKEEEDDGMHGALGDADIAADADLVTDANSENLDQTQLSHEDSSDDVNDENRGVTNGDDAIVEEDLSFEIAADGTVEETSFGPFEPMLLDGEADDTVGYQLEDSGDNALGEDWMDNLAEDWMVDDIALERIEHMVVEETVDGDMTPVLNDTVPESETSVAVMVDNPLNDLIRLVLNDAFDGGVTSEVKTLDDGVYHLVGSVLVEALARGGAYEVLVLDDDMDDLMWSKLYDALYGRTASSPVNVGEFLDGLMASVLHNAFFGPAASNAVSSLSKNANISGLVVEDYIQKVSKLYTKFKEARFPTIDDTAIDEELPLELTTGTVDGSDHSSAFVEELPFIITDERVDGGIRFGAFGPVIPVYAVGIGAQPMPRDTLPDKAAITTIFCDNAVTDLVLSLAKDALTGEASSAPMLDDGVNDLMWAKLHHSTSITGRAASGDTNLGDALDYTLTNVLHRAFFGPVASHGVASLAKYTDDREMMVKDYVRAVSKVYDKFKEARGRSPSPGNEAPVVRKTKKRGWGWLKKLWGKGRRKGG